MSTSTSVPSSRPHPRRRGLVTVLALVAMASLTFAAGRASGLGAAESRTGRPAAVTSTTTPTTAAAVASTAAEAQREVLADGVKRVLLVGDSLVVAASAELEQIFSANGVAVRFVGGIGTGLLTDDSVWLDEIDRAVAELDPDVVVIESCCNYEETEALPADSEAMYTAWERAAREAVSRASARGASVHWVLTPDVDPNGTAGHVAERVRRFNEIYRTLGVPLVDWRSALSPGGTYADAIVIGGHPVTVRADDGLHLTSGGNAVVAFVTWAAVAESFT